MMRTNVKRLFSITSTLAGNGALRGIGPIQLDEINHARMELRAMRTQKARPSWKGAPKIIKALLLDMNFIKKQY